MNDLVRKAVAVEMSISLDKGSICLFALVSRKALPDRWTVVFSAPWALVGRRSTFDYLTHQIKQHFSDVDIVLLSRIVTLKPSDVDVLAINSSHELVEHAERVMLNGSYFGYDIERGYVITSSDYFRQVLQPVFPAESEFESANRNGDVWVRVAWPLHDDPSRPNKKSKTIVVKISEESLDDYFFTPHHRQAEETLRNHIRSKLARFDPKHDRPWHQSPPEEEWKIKSELFRKAS